MATVLRITRHPLDSEREEFLRGVFGSDLRVVTNDIQYTNDPVAALQAAIEAVGDEVVAVASSLTASGWTPRSWPGRSRS